MVNHHHFSPPFGATLQANLGSKVKYHVSVVDSWVVTFARLSVSNDAILTNAQWPSGL